MRRHSHGVTMRDKHNRKERPASAAAMVSDDMGRGIPGRDCYDTAS